MTSPHTPAAASDCAVLTTDLHTVFTSLAFDARQRYSLATELEALAIRDAMVRLAITIARDTLAIDVHDDNVLGELDQLRRDLDDLSGTAVPVREIVGRIDAALDLLHRRHGPA